MRVSTTLALFDALSVEQFRKMLDVHFFGSLFVSRAAWPHFVEAGYGRIVNTVSEAMLGGIPELTSYGSAKGAVSGSPGTSPPRAQPRHPRQRACATGLHAHVGVARRGLVGVLRDAEGR